MIKEKALVWFRRDLRDIDNAALSAALSNAKQVFCVFVFDQTILATLPSRQDRRVEFIHGSLVELDASLRQNGGGLIVRHGNPVDEIVKLAKVLDVDAVYANRDYEPAAKQRDSEVAEQLAARNIEFINLKDQVIFDRSEVLTQAQKPFSVFTPYKNAWLKRCTVADTARHTCKGNFGQTDLAGIPPLKDIGFTQSNLQELGIQPGMSGADKLWSDFRQDRLARYGKLRDFPAVKGVSYLSVHLRFGTISIRQLVSAAQSENAETWLSELIWRDFYFMILDNFPQVTERSFKPAYDAIRWKSSPADFAAWCEGKTGYPLVDAAMRQLNHSGWMHNRLRMVVASFLSKDLGIDWRLGEKYFADHLNDFDLSANNGGWQWASSSGCDAQPYFRIFNPVTQSERFDSEGKFIRRYLPELSKVPDKYIHAPWLISRCEQERLGVIIGWDYPGPIVDHAQARIETLARYAVVKSQT
jgi:deoxyribodipyrimidine photo-lyase